MSQDLKNKRCNRSNLTFRFDFLKCYAPMGESSKVFRNKTDDRQNRKTCLRSTILNALQQNDCVRRHTCLIPVAERLGTSSFNSTIFSNLESALENQLPTVSFRGISKIQFCGQTSRHSPQLVHNSGSITATLFSI